MSENQQQQQPEMNSTTLHAAKTHLRSLMKQRLSILSPDAVTSQSNAAFEALSGFKPYKEAKTVGVYLSMPGCEIQTDPIVRHALSSGKQVFVPYLHKSGLPPGEGPVRLMDMRSIGELDGERSADAPLDLILLPGVAFDLDPETGVVRRLGHGKGFYDYFLHRYALATKSEKTSSKDGPSVLLYALALREQLLSSTSGEAVPVGPHDQPLDGLILGDGQIKQSPSHNRD
ncbi:hypothetical protein CHU98_g6564 [Xylaria longipes]|nr:hypothetical protein CHU98_g6564 [Xylaria longipes]